MSLKRITHIIRHYYTGEHYPIVHTLTFPAVTGSSPPKPRITYQFPLKGKEARIIIKYSDCKNLFYKFI